MAAIRHKFTTLFSAGGVIDAMKFADWIAERLGSRKWFVGRWYSFRIRCEAHSKTIHGSL